MTTSDSTQRDELASIITDHVHEGLLGYDACTPHAEIATAAGAILAAGYRKPRTITTAEGLRALKEGTRLLGRDYKPGCGRLWRVEKFGVVDIERPLDGICGFNYFKDPLPAIVLTEPEPAVGA